MPYWIEVHCSKKVGSCNSNIQVDVPMTLTRNASLAAINQAISHLTKEAKELGWIMKDADWICPKCRGHE